MKRLLVFDLDGTLAASKQPLDPAVGEWLGKLLSHCRVAVMSGGAWPQFEKQLLTNLPKDAPLHRLSLLPTSGTRFMQYEDGTWTQLYAENFTDDEKHTIIAALTEVFDKSKYKPRKHWGEIIEDRGSQITLSALGQEAPLAAKAKWDPDFAKRKKMQAKLAKKLPDFAIGMGGATSLDVTRPGVDKAYGIEKLHEVLQIDIADMLFVGDALFAGGNDFPARRSGVDCIQIAGPAETVKVIETVIVCTGPDAT
ncbi:HAD-IIB family hydrolase [Novosphingobium sp.]|uniref:HAD-IIB family hydrolase n=1 Tax=Novosphingobium sp. TaxID=1874826 RepID=UPI003B51D23C